MPASTKHPIAIDAAARKINARNGGSTRKNSTMPATSATTLARIAATMLTVRSWCIASLIVAIVAALASPAGIRAQAILGEANLDWQQRFLGIIPLVKPDPKDPIIVTVNGVPITLEQVSDYARTEARMIDVTSAAEQRAVWKDATENLINRELLLQEAKKRKLEIPDAEVAARAREFKIANAGGNPIDSGGAPDQQLMAAVRGSMEIERMLDDEFRAARIQPTAEQIKQYYDGHRDLFVKDPGWARISHIAVKLPPHPTDAQREAAKRKILKLYAEAKTTRDFAALAKKSSEDAESASKGGDLGEFRPGQLPPVVDQMVFSAQAGGLTDLIESELGYSFIKVDARRGETYAALPEVRSKIAMVLLGFNQEFAVKQLLRKLAKGAKIDFKTPSKTAI